MNADEDTDEVNLEMAGKNGQGNLGEAHFRLRLVLAQLAGANSLMAS